MRNKTAIVQLDAIDRAILTELQNEGRLSNQELASLNLKFEPINSASLEPGLSLGGFDTQAVANTALASLTKRGVRTAQVVRERPEVRGTLLRLGAVDTALKPKLDEVRAALSGKLLRLCK